MKRREFLAGSVLTASFRGMAGQFADQAKRDRLSLMTYRYDPILKNAAFPNDPQKTLDILDLADIAAQRYGIHHVELLSSQFPSTEPAYLEELRSRLKKARSQMNQICLTFGTPNVSSPDPVLRLEAIDLIKAWIDHAAALGCPSIMISTGSLAPEVRQPAIDALKILSAYGNMKKVFVTAENHGGTAGPAQLAKAGAAEAVRSSSTNWEVLVGVIKASGIRANPDIGNFADEESRAEALRAMYPLSAGNSHCRYDPERFNLANAIKISKEVGYKGLYSLEIAPANGTDPFPAVEKVLNATLPLL